MATEKKPARSTGKKSAAKKAEEKNIEEEKKKFQQKLIALKELAKCAGAWRNQQFSG